MEGVRIGKWRMIDRIVAGGFSIQRSRNRDIRCRAIQRSLRAALAGMERFQDVLGVIV